MAIKSIWCLGQFDNAAYITFPVISTHSKRFVVKHEPLLHFAKWKKLYLKLFSTSNVFISLFHATSQSYNCLIVCNRFISLETFLTCLSGKVKAKPWLSLCPFNILWRLLKPEFIDMALTERMSLFFCRYLMI